MSLSSILQQIQRKGQVRPPPVKTNDRPKEQAPAPSNGVGGARPVDPVVARLKAARKAEREKKEQELREKKGLARAAKPRKAIPKSRESTPGTKARSTSITAARGVATPPATAPPAPKKKMKFSELMKKAQQIDQSKLSIEIKSKKASPPAPRAPSKTPSRTPPPRSYTPGKVSGKRPPVAQKRPPKEVARAPLPLRGPSQTLEQRLKKSKPTHESDELDLDSFIESDEEVAQPVDYDRDEIWAMFNRGKKRLQFHDDYDSDDMEATGAEIFEEEQRSKRRALEEDRRELLEEQRLAALKRKRLGKT